MIKSMTGFAQLITNYMGRQYVWTLRSLNSRFLDIRWFLPSELQIQEQTWSKKIQSQASRGKVDIKLQWQWLDLKNHTSSKSLKPLLLNSQILLAWDNIYQQAQKTLEKPLNYNLSELLDKENVVIENQGFQKSERDFLTQNLEELCLRWNTERKREGTTLSKKLHQSIQEILKTLNEIKRLRLLQTEQKKASFEKKIHEWAKSFNSLNQEDISKRLFLELTLWANKTDVEEEIQRIQCHGEHFIHLLQEHSNTQKPCGKLLDFLIQELLREFNTLGAKSQNVKLSHTIMTIKNKLEQIREQVQNIE